MVVGGERDEKGEEPSSSSLPPELSLQAGYLSSLSLPFFLRFLLQVGNLSVLSLLDADSFSLRRFLLCLRYFASFAIFFLLPPFVSSVNNLQTKKKMSIIVDQTNFQKPTEFLKLIKFCSNCAITGAVSTSSLS